MATSILRLESFASANLVERSYLTADVAAATTTSNIANGSNFTVNEYILFGKPGQEKTEITKITGSASNVITTAGLTYAHDENDSVFELFGNQVRVYKATNVDGTEPDNANFSLLDTVTIESDKFYIDYTDNSGGSGFWYKQIYYNSDTDTEGEMSLVSATRGGGSARYVTIERVRDKAGLYDNPEYTDLMIDQSILAAQSKVDSYLRTAQYTLPLATVPESISDTTMKIAAASLLGEAYDSRNEGTNKSPSEYNKEAMQYLKDLIKREAQLVDENGNALALSSRVDYQPDDDVSDFWFTRGMTF